LDEAATDSNPTDCDRCRNGSLSDRTHSPCWSLGCLRHHASATYSLPRSNCALCVTSLPFSPFLFC
jgi:hypothetical protein